MIFVCRHTRRKTFLFCISHDSSVDFFVDRWFVAASACFFLRGLACRLGLVGSKVGILWPSKSIAVCVLQRFVTPPLGRWFWRYFHFRAKAKVSNARCIRKDVRTRNKRRSEGFLRENDTNTNDNSNITKTDAFGSLSSLSQKAKQVNV